MMKKEYLRIDKVIGPLIEMSNVTDVSYGEVVDIMAGDGAVKKGKVIRIEEDKVVIQVFENTSGLSTSNASVSFLKEAFELPLSRDILGRTFDGLGRPMDLGGEIYSRKKYNINGRPINPVARKYPRNFIQTGISSIDALMTLIRGQKLPIFSGNGMPHNELAIQIVRQAKLGEESNEDFAIIFAAIGVKHDDADFFKRSLVEANAMDRVAMFINYANDPIAERINTPRCALSAAEYLAFEEGMQILVVMSDITSYCEALREVSSAKEEVPSRKGYPGYLYSDLASLYERAGMIKDKPGSITFLPILTMPNDDITHPIPDLTGYITEGQIVMGRELFQNNVYPPINVLPSLSRLMKDGIGKGYTREDHPDLANQLFSSYSRVQDVRALAQIIGEDDLGEVDRKYMEFGRAFESRFVTQGFTQNRDINATLDLGWEILRILPKEELNRLDPDLIEKYYVKKD